MAECPTQLSPGLAALGPAVPQGTLPPLPHKTPIVSPTARETPSKPQGLSSLPSVPCLLKKYPGLYRMAQGGPEWPDFGPTLWRRLFPLLFRTTLVTGSVLFSFREQGHRYPRAYYMSVMVPGTGNRVVNRGTRVTSCSS